MKGLSLDMRKDWMDPDSGASYKMKGRYFEAVKVMTDRDNMGNSSKLKKLRKT